MDIRSQIQKKLKFFVLVTLFTILFSGFYSCNIESELEIDDFTIPSRLVLNGLLYSSKDTNFIYFSESKSIFSRENAREILLYDSSWWYANPKVYLLPDVNTSIYKNGSLQPHVYSDPKDSITYYIDRLKAEDNVRIEAFQNERQISSSATIPSDPVILGIDTFSFINNNRNSGYYYYDTSMLRILIQLKDQPGTRNYYRLFIDTYVESYLDPEYARENNFPEIVLAYTSGFETQDPAINIGNAKEIDYSNISRLRYEYNYYNIFTDELFEGKEYTLNVYIPNQINYTYPYTYYPYYYQLDFEKIIRQKSTVNARIQTINEDLYRYYASLQRFIYYKSDLVEPVRVFNNIQGGLGIWGAINERTIQVYQKDTVYVK